MTAKKKTVIGYVLASLAIIAADQALKAWVVRNIPLNASAALPRALIPGVVHLTHIRNSGVAFGMFSGGRWLFLALLTAFCVIVVWALVRHKLTAPWERWLAVLAMAGAIGNGIDRALYVFDEADLRWRMETYREAFRSRYENSDVIYASKAFLNKEVVRIVNEEGLCLDVSGGGELACAQMACINTFISQTN